MNLPNKLTIGRLGITAVFVVAMSIENYWAQVMALLLFIIASITDYYDGKIARENNLITDFGKLMDPLADKVLISAAFVLLCERGLIPAWIVIAIISREFLVTGLRLVASAKGSVISADSLGKIKTILQMTAVIYLLLFVVAEPLILKAPAIVQILKTCGIAIAMAAGLMTLISGVSYVLRNKQIILEDC